MDEDTWDRFVEHGQTGSTIGFLERFLFLGAFWVGAYPVIVAWLGFKVAAKWESWSHVVQVPTTLDPVRPIVWLQARMRFGSWLLSRFLVGTLMNILIAGIAGYLGHRSFVVITWLATL